MHVDDIYTAAINGNEELLIQLLDTHEVDINAMIDCGMVDGYHMEIPLLRSVLHYMNKNGINYRILDILVEYGIDLDGNMIAKTEAFTRKIPILAFVIREYKSVEMVKYLLEKGANPNVQQIEEHAAGHTNKFPMLYFALMFSSENEFLFWLLNYGADPNARVEVYSQQYAVVQNLPLLFYAMDQKKKNPDPCWIYEESKLRFQILLNYGANPNSLVCTGYGNPKFFDFCTYVLRFYTRFHNTLLLAIKNRTPYKINTVIVDRRQFLNANNYLTKRANSGQAPARENNNYTENKISPDLSVQNDSKIRNAVRALVNFDINNASDYLFNESRRKAEKTTPWLLIIAIGIAAYAIGSAILMPSPKKIYAVMPAIMAAILFIIYLLLVIKRYAYARKARIKADQIRFQHNQYIKEVNMADNGSPEEKRNRWWNTYDGLTAKKYNDDELLVWGPFERVVENNGDFQLNSLCCYQESFLGEEVKRISSQYTVLYEKDINVNENYNLAELFFWQVKDGTIVSTYSEGFSESEIRKRMDEYNEELDDKERFWNALDGKYMTEKERFLYTNDIDWGVYLDSELSRKLKTDRYERELRSERTTHTEVSAANIFHQIFRPVGMIFFDSNGNVVSVLLNKTVKKSDHFNIDINKIVYNIRRYKESHDPQLDRLAILQNLRRYNINEIDPCEAKPSYLNDEEWAMLMYSSYATKTPDSLMEEIRMCYGRAGLGKTMTIENPNRRGY